mgnify:CR=1 FL=1|tara:strand:- start:59405 stop:60001 length:597 start_codon:yes stop_codon:yes gene_type:complete
MMLYTAYSKLLKQVSMKTVVLCFLVAASGCEINHSDGKAYQSTYTDRAPIRYNPPKVRNTSVSAMPSSSEIMISEEAKRKKVLKRQYSKWVGTPYRYGGQTSRGIDCSALMVKVFGDAFNRQLPRTTIQQVKVGKAISKRHLQIGDLIFFKTGWNKRHVGVYMGKGQFFHASVSKGVTISRLDKPYWAKRYWQSRRVI